MCVYVQFIHTLESQRTFSPRDRAYVASLLTVALHEKLEYFTDILKTLLSHLVEQYTTKNPKLMLRRSELRHLDLKLCRKCLSQDQQATVLLASLYFQNPSSQQNHIQF